MVTGTINGYFLIKSKGDTLIVVTANIFLCVNHFFNVTRAKFFLSRVYIRHPRLLKYWFSCGMFRYQCHITIPVPLGGRLPVK